MFLTQGQVERGHFTNNRYGTAGTTTQTTLASSGGLLVNIDSATGDIARTTNGWIEDEKYGWYARVIAGTGSFEFDTAVTMTGAKTLKVSTTNATGVVSARAIINSPTLGDLKNGKPVKPSTKYKAACWVIATNAATNSVYFDINEYSSAAVLGTTTQSNKITGTVGRTLLFAEFTTGASASVVSINCNVAVAGNISDAWFDVNSMTLEEVVEPVANSLTSSSPSLVSFTAVGSTDNIDQSQTTQNDARGVGGDGSTSVITNKMAQQFLPSKSKLTGVVIRKVADIGTFTGTITAKIVNDNAGAIGTTTLASITLSNATYQAIANDTDYTLSLPCNLTVDGSTKYWLTLEASTSDATNYARIRLNSGNPYTSGICQTFYSGAWNTVAFDFYFKTLYYKPTTNFKASQNNQSVSISADEDGFLDGSVINLTTGQFTWDSGIGGALYATRPYYSDYSKSGGAGRWVPTTGNRILSGGTNETWIWKLPAGLTNISLVWTSTVSGGSTAEWSSSLDNVSYTVGSTGTFSGTVSLIDGARYVKIKSEGNNVKLNTFTISATYSTAGLSTLRNYPTNKDIIKQYSTTLGSATTSATYRATKWGFPAIEYSSTEYQFLDVDTTATGSTVAFSELGTSYTTVADGASLTITSTSTPSIFVKANITANRLYLSSNDYVASSDKDGSLKQSVVYQVIQ